MIHVQDLAFEYPSKRALTDVSFEIGEGSITALVGPNGAGKSTLLRCLAALYRPFSGKVKINGYDTLIEPREVHRSLGYLSDFFGLYDDLSVRQSLLYICRTHDMPTDRVEMTADRLGLMPYINTPAGELSRGLRQRLAIGLSIIHQPRVLLLDEPASGLDPEARISLSELFITLRDQGMTLVISSHILAELGDYAGEVLIIDDGKVVDHHKINSEDSEQAHSSRIEVYLSQPDDRLQASLEAVVGLSELDMVGDKGARFTFGSDSALHAEILASLMEKGLPVCSFGPFRTDLQEVYVERIRKQRQEGPKS